MMHLLDVALKNFCQHKDLQVDFHAGVTGVVGGNGSGKSNLLKAVRFALLKSSGNVGVISDDLNWEAALNNELGFVLLHFDKGGTPGEIKRYVDKSRVSLTYGPVKTTSLKAADEHMADILGVPRRVIEEIVFIAQGTIENVLFDRPAERAEQFQSLFGTGGAETIRQILQKEITELDEVPVADQLDRLQQQLDVEIVPALQQRKQQQQQLVEELTAFDEIAHADIVKRYTAAAALTEQLCRLRDQLFQLAADCGAQEQKTADVTSKLNELTKVHDADQQALPALYNQLSRVETIKRDSALRTRLLAEKQQAQKTAKAAPPKPPATTEAQITSAREKVAEIQAELAPKRAFIAQFRGKGKVADCPTCLQPVHNAGAIAAVFETEVETQDEKIAKTTAILNRAETAIAVYKDALSEHTVRGQLANKRIKDIDAQLAELSDTPYDQETELLIKANIRAIEIRQKQYDDAQSVGAKEKARLAQLTANVTTTQKQIETLESKVVEAPDKTACDAAEKAIQHYHSKRADLAKVNGEIDQLSGQQTRVAAELNQLQAYADRFDSVQKYKKLCEQAKDVLHRDKLPLIVTRSFLATLNAYMAEYIQAFNIPFTASIRDDLEVICQFPGVGSKPASRLSGGQKVVLGIAFRFAIYRLFAGELGFMVLDEPTVMLDADKVQSVVDVLQSVRRHAHNTGMQLVVITHEPQLEAAFDYVVRL
jgi:DNA repair exonuclease SbcCD ATPase subunit